MKDFGDLPTNIKEQLGNGQNFYQYRDKHYSTLIVDSHKRVWGGTPDGLDLYEDEKDVPITFYRENGLSNNFIQGLLEDRNGNIWVTTSHGITKVVTDENRSQIKLITYNSFEGTLRNEYSNNAIFESADGRLFFGGIDGFNILNPENEKSDPLPYKPVLTGVRLFGENTEIGKAYDGNVILKKSAPFTDEFTFNHDQNFLTFEFSPLNYRNRSQTFYRYKLEGADENWYETSATEKKGNFASEGAVKITYTNLSHGKYALKIYSRDNSTDWMNEPTVINFTIKTPWWKTPLAYILYFVVGSMIFGAIGFLHNLYSKKRLVLKHNEESFLLSVTSLM